MDRTIRHRGLHPLAVGAQPGDDVLHEGRSVIYVARQLGHGAGLTMTTYGHVIDELEDAPRIAAEDAISAARRDEDVQTESGRGS